jgi:hypothetical protein
LAIDSAQTQQSAAGANLGKIIPAVCEVAHNKKFGHLHLSPVNGNSAMTSKIEGDEQ